MKDARLGLVVLLTLVVLACLRNAGDVARRERRELGRRGSNRAHYRGLAAVGPPRTPPSTFVVNVSDDERMDWDGITKELVGGRWTLMASFPARVW